MCIYKCLQELLAIQQQGPRAIGFFGTRNMGFMHQELIEILSYALVITVRCHDINLIYLISVCLLGILIKHSRNLLDIGSHHGLFRQFFLRFSSS